MTLGRPVLCSLLAVGLLGAVGVAKGQDLFGDLFHSDSYSPAPTGTPAQRSRVQGEVRYVTVIPGDTFAGMAESLYGDAKYSKLLYWANKDKLPDPANPNSLFKPGERQKQFVVPPASHTNPVYTLQLKGPEDIGEKEAKTIMQGMGLMNGNRSFDKAIKGLKYGYTYTYKNGKLNDEAKGYLFREWNLLKKALDHWGNYPEISQEATPALFEKFLRDAAPKLTALKDKQRYALMKSLMTQETGRTHWANFTPIMGSATDTGFGQFIPGTAMAVGINPYDPAENIKGIAIHLNGLIRSVGLREALAEYNGGNDPPATSYRYADSIIARMKRYMK